MKFLSASDLKNAASLVRQWRRPLLLTHTKPDGDAIGSVLALRDLLRHGGSDPFAVFFGKIPARYVPFASFEPVASWGDGATSADLDRCDGVIILDTCSYSQLEPVETWLKETDKPSLAVDHHQTRDELATHYLIDETAGATCLILVEWAQAAGWTMSEPIARALFSGIAMDTGWFQHSNTDARVFDAASALVSRGALPSTLYAGLYHQDSPARVRLRAEAIMTLELAADGRLALLHLTRDALSRAGALMSDAEDIVNEPLRMKSAIVSALFVEQDDSVVRVNLRSKPPAITDGVDIDVAQIARALGGGGHARAAGVRLTNTLEAARTLVCERVTSRLSGL